MRDKEMNEQAKTWIIDANSVEWEALTEIHTKIPNLKLSRQLKNNLDLTKEELENKELMLKDLESLLTSQISNVENFIKLYPKEDLKFEDLELFEKCLLELQKPLSGFSKINDTDLEIKKNLRLKHDITTNQQKDIKAKNVLIDSINALSINVKEKKYIIIPLLNTLSNLLEESVNNLRANENAQRDFFKTTLSSIKKLNVDYRTISLEVGEKDKKEIETKSKLIVAGLNSIEIGINQFKNTSFGKELMEIKKQLLEEQNQLKINETRVSMFVKFRSENEKKINNTNVYLNKKLLSLLNTGEESSEDKLIHFRSNLTKEIEGITKKINQSQKEIYSNENKIKENENEQKLLKDWVLMEKPLTENNAIVTPAVDLMPKLMEKNNSLTREITRLKSEINEHEIIRWDLVSRIGEINQFIYLESCPNNIASLNKLFSEVPAKENSITLPDLERNVESFFKEDPNKTQHISKSKSAIHKLLYDRDSKLTSAEKLSSIDQLITQNKPSVWKFWLRAERKQYEILRQQARVACGFLAFKSGKMDASRFMEIVQVAGLNSTDKIQQKKLHEFLTSFDHAFNRIEEKASILEVEKMLGTYTSNLQLLLSPKDWEEIKPKVTAVPGSEAKFSLPVLKRARNIMAEEEARVLRKKIM